MANKPDYATVRAALARLLAAVKAGLYSDTLDTDDDENSDMAIEADAAIAEAERALEDRGGNTVEEVCKCMEPRRFFPGERVVHRTLGRGAVVQSDANGYSFRPDNGPRNLHFSYWQDAVTPETAARVIPYGDTRCSDHRPTG